MQRMAKSNVLIAGLGGLGVEIAKNVILSGVKSLTLLDSKLTNLTDLSSQFFLSDASLGVNRAEACRNALAELNTSVVVDVLTEKLCEEIVKNFQVVVLTDSSLDEQIRISDYAHSRNIKVIVASTFGVFGQIFCDFGDNFPVVMDTAGENPLSTSIASISQDTKGVVSTADKNGHKFQDGDYVLFSEIEGMTELNGKSYKIEVLGPCTFSIGDTSKLSAYKQGGLAMKLKMPKTLAFKTLSASLNSPKFTLTDFRKSNRSKQLHEAFQALHKFQQQENRMPDRRISEDAEKFLQFCKGLKMNIKLSKKFLKEFSNTCCGNFAPMNAVIGGIAAQEIMKAFCVKFHPIFQWFYFDALECLPKDWIPNKDDLAPMESRYDGQITVFGREFQQTLQEMRCFIVGADMIGCELLKNFAMMGIGSTETGGEIIVTDMSIVDKSDLKMQQFLFRRCDVEQSKSVVAAKAIKAINPKVNVIAHENCVNSDNEQIYDNAFFERLHCVVNTVNKIDTRLYINERCVINQKPLLELEEIGMTGNTRVQAPFLTKPYTSLEEPLKELSSSCTVKYFPYTIEQTLYWARNTFETLFRQEPENATQYLQNPDFWHLMFRLQRVELLDSVLNLLVQDRPQTIQDCVAWARLNWEEHYNKQIQELLLSFPPNFLDKRGKLFWSSPKKCPHPLHFDINNSLHVDYVFAAANLKAQVYGIPQNRDRTAITEMIRNIDVSKLVPSSGYEMELAMDLLADEESEWNNDNIDLEWLATMQSEIPPREQFLKENITIHPLYFDFDDDTNLHMDFIVAASNLRAVNYGIPPADRVKSGFIAGKTISAVATTTSVVAGLACLELIKIAQGFKTLKPFKNGCVNLAVPQFDFSKPLSAPKMKYNDTEWTVWDNFEVQGDLTLKQLLRHFQEEYDLEVTILLHGVHLLYSCTWDLRYRRHWMTLPISEIMRRKLKGNMNPNMRSLVFQLICNDKRRQSVHVPNVRYLLPS